MLFVSSTLLLLVNAVTLRRDRNNFYRVAILILLYSGVIWYSSLNIILDNWIGKYGGLFHSISITHSFDNKLFSYISGAIVLRLAVFYPRRLQEPIGPKGKERSLFLFNQIYRESFRNTKNLLILVFNFFGFYIFRFLQQAWSFFIFFTCSYYYLWKYRGAS